MDAELMYKECRLCPRACGADRFSGTGFCGAGAHVKAAKAMIHLWEEPVLCTNGGAGAVFFSGCTMRCVYCQNHKISAGGFGREVSARTLADIFLELEAQGAQNIDLVTPSHYLPDVVNAISLVRERIGIPFVYNCGGYESKETLRMLDGLIDIYLPDVKYFDNAAAIRYSAAPHYFETACTALEEMLHQSGRPVFADEQRTHMVRGVIVRHMVLPGLRADSIALLRALAARFDVDSFLISLLWQYAPCYLAADDPAYSEISRRVTSFEYNSVVEEALSLGMNGFMQEKSSAAAEYTPVFDLQGIPQSP